ncbi:hypothetical protein Nepgr_025017 [Nepenthes gracilis]|uniref:Uncharacterized protein n=1 Tax=Nepenthes gracilis TaxID=150966 RepID=A0AAD3Y0L1_NEPGR|nr:hypothetical protein Nepgr_025017 [Nepenthes gracilis]
MTVPALVMACYRRKYPSAQQIFLFQGRLVFGPDARSLLVTILLILVPTTNFCTFVARKLSNEFPEYNVGYAILVVAIVSIVYVLVLLICTSTRDLGIIYRNLPPPEEELYYESSVSTEDGVRTTPSLQFPRTKDVLINGVPARMKCCETCSNLIAKIASAASLTRSFSGSDITACHCKIMVD